MVPSRLFIAALPCAVLATACSAGSSGESGGGQGSGAGGGSWTASGGAPFLPGAGGNPGLVVLPGAGGGPAVNLPDGSVPPPVGTPVSIDDCAANPAGLDPAVLQQLQAGSGSPGDLRVLNPYDGTVFPRGLIAPLLMWTGGGAATAVYLHLKSSLFEYRACLAPTAPGQLQIPAHVWTQATDLARGPQDPFTLELTTSAGGVVTGPIRQQFVVAQATLKGTIFYNTYKSKLVQPTDIIGAFTGGQGAVLRLVPGRTAEVFLGQTTCTGCHAVSTSGTRMVTSTIGGPSLTGGSTYPVAVGAPPSPAPLATNAPGSSFAGVFPDGSLYLANGHPGGMGPRTGIGSGAAAAALFETDTATEVPNTGIPAGAMTPSFSPSGTALAFNDYAIGNGHGLATMTFDRGTRTASGYRKVFEVTDAAKFPGWPFFLPDEKGLLFAIGSANDFSGMATGIDVAGFPAGANATSDLYVLDLASGTSTLLARAMGFASDQAAQAGTTYLPFGPDELHHNFYPTISPVAAGGYFWVFFDSYRRYGNTHASGPIRQLWGAAIEISPDGTYTTDPSHPAFYLTGQEDVPGNHRAFATLDPCKSDGVTCQTGIDCCVGFCTNGTCSAPPPPVQGPPPCANTDEKCTTDADCCESFDRCINGFCGRIIR